MIKRNKTGGRTIGTPNRTTNDIRLKFQKLINDNLNQLENDIKELEPKERIKTIIELSKFVIPTYKAIDVQAPIENETKAFEPVTLIFKTIENNNTE